MSAQLQRKQEHYLKGLEVSYQGAEQFLGGPEGDEPKPAINTSLSTDSNSAKPGHLIVVDFTGEACQPIDTSDWEKPFVFDVARSAPGLEDKFAIVAANYAMDDIRLIKNFCIDHEEIMDLLIEALQPLRESFSSEALALHYLCPTAGLPDGEIAAFVCVTGKPAEELKRLSIFENRWWFENCWRADNGLTFDLRF